jgi:hypothetical protein
MTSPPPTRILRLASATIAACVLAQMTTAGPLAQSAFLVVARGLDNPRGLAFGPNNFLYVAEAGRGGASALCIPAPNAPGASVCYGPTGAITEVSGLLVQRRVVTGLPSLAGPSGNEAAGPHDIEFGFQSAWITIGLGGNPALRAPFVAAGVHLGSLVQVPFTADWKYSVDISALEQITNPDRGAVDSNPFGLRVLSNRGVVADAGANALVQIDVSGATSTLAVFPSRMVPSPLGGTTAMQSVPTSVVEAPDGSLFVGELTGFPFLQGSARVYRVPARGGRPEVVAEGFTTIIDIALSSAGIGYVLEHDADGLFPPTGPGNTGRIIRIDPGGARSVVATDLVRPGGMTIGPDRALYVTTHSASAGQGEVVRIPQ